MTRQDEGSSGNFPLLTTLWRGWWGETTGGVLAGSKATKSLAAARGMQGRLDRKRKESLK